MLVVFVRFLVTLGALAAGLLGGLFLFAIDGGAGRAGSWLLGCFLVSYFATPNGAARAAFAENQQRRLDRLKRQGRLG